MALAGSVLQTGVEGLVEYVSILVEIGWFLAGVLAVTGVGWYLVEPAISRSVGRRNRNNPTIQEAITRYVRLVILVVALLVGVGLAGYGGILTSSALVIAAATLAIGVAGQAVIGSLISGLVLVLDPEFNVGNYIEWSGGKGTVQSITLRVTRVRTVDGELVTIPNTLLTGGAITRPYGRGRLRVVEHVAVSYDDDVGEAMEILGDCAGSLAGILADPAPRAYIDDLGGDAVIVRVHFWIEDPRRRDVFGIRSRFAESALSRLDEAGITVSPASKRDLQGRVEVG